VYVGVSEVRAWTTEVCLELARIAALASIEGKSKQSPLQVHVMSDVDVYSNGDEYVDDLRDYQKEEFEESLREHEESAACISHVFYE